MFNWIKENPKKSVAIAAGVGVAGVVWKVGGIAPAIQLVSALLGVLF